MMIVSKIIRIIGPVFVVCITFLLLPLPLQASGLRTDLHTDLLIVKGPLLRAESAVYYAVYYNERNQESVDEAEEEYEEEDDDQQIWVHYGIYFIILFFVTIIRDAKSTKPTPSAVDIKRVAEQVEKDENYYKALLEKWADKLRPTEFAFCFSDTNSRDLVLSCGVFFTSTGTLEEIDEGMYQIVKRDGLSSEEESVLDFLEREGDIRDEADGVLILEKLHIYIKTMKKKYMQFNREIQKAMEEKVTAKLSESQIEELKNDRKELTHYVEYLHENDIDIVEKGGEYYPYMLILYACDEKLR